MLECKHKDLVLYQEPQVFNETQWLYMQPLGRLKTCGVNR